MINLMALFCSFFIVSDFCAASRYIAKQFYIYLIGMIRHYAHIMLCTPNFFFQVFFTTIAGT